MSDEEAARSRLREQGFGRLVDLSGEAAAKAVAAARKMAARLPADFAASEEPAHVFRPAGARRP